MKRFSCVTGLALLLGLPCIAQQRACSAGQGGDRLPLASGYVAEAAPATDAAHAGQCRAALTSADGQVAFETFGPETAVNVISGQDVNGDGKPDAVLEVHPARGQCCWNYYLLTPGETPALQRQFTTSVALNFEDKLGDGKVEIWTRDFAFDGANGFSHAESPFPLIYFRLRGNTIYPVSSLFWSDYEREINDAKSGISREDVDELTKVEGENPKPPDEHDPKIAHLQSVQALILTVAVDYLYAGKLQEAWQTISDDWPLLDRQRIRQLILERRNHGIMQEITKVLPNLQPSPVGAPQGVQP